MSPPGRHTAGVLAAKNPHANAGATKKKTFSCALRKKKNSGPPNISNETAPPRVGARVKTLGQSKTAPSKLDQQRFGTYSALGIRICARVSGWIQFGKRFSRVAKGNQRGFTSGCLQLGCAAPGAVLVQFEGMAKKMAGGQLRFWPSPQTAPILHLASARASDRDHASDRDRASDRDCTSDRASDRDHATMVFFFSFSKKKPKNTGF